MKILISLLCFVTCGNLWAQTIQENINTEYNPWSLSAFSLISAENDQIHNGGNLNSYNYVGPNYRLSNNERLAAKVAFLANSTGYDRFNAGCRQSQDASFHDPFLEYNNYNLGWLPGIADVFWSGRLYIPLSTSSRNQGMIARYDSNTIFTKHLTQKLFAEFRNDVAFYHQSSSTYTGTHTDDQCEVQVNQNPSNTRAYRMDNWLSLWYVFNRGLSFGLSAVLRDQGYNRSSSFETGRQRNGRMHEITAFFGPSVRYNYNYNVSFILSFRDVVEYSGFHPDRKDDLVELGEFRSRNTELALLSFIRF